MNRILPIIALAALTLPAEANAQFTVWKDGEAAYTLTTGTPERIIPAPDFTVTLGGETVYSLTADIADSVTFSAQCEPRLVTDESIGGTIPCVADAVDLGLTSGTLWAPYNLGATAASEAGAHVSWAETYGSKASYDMDNYKYKGDGKTPSKYNATDGKLYIEPEDDAAAVNWGSEWAIPTRPQLQELIDECEWTWKKKGWDGEGSLCGFLLTGPNGNTIFLPAAGRCNNAEILDYNQCGCYMTNERYEILKGKKARNLYFFIFNGKITNNIATSYGRQCGFSVRPVVAK